MKEKYYTPELEEFHIGFEYETADIGDDWSIIGWDKVIFSKEINIYNISNFIPLQRVKYLDEQDVRDSLKIVLPTSSYSENKRYFTVQAPGSLGYWVDIVIDIRFGWKDVIIKGKRGDEEEYLFRGKIKNKSELIRLLKQILL